MEIVKHGNHKLNDDVNGYMYNFNTSRDYNFGSHIHKCFEFVHILEGRLIYTVEDSEYILMPGDFVMTKPIEFHSFSFPEHCLYRREFLHIYPGFFKNYPEIVNMLNRRESGYFNRIPAELVTKYGIDTIFKGIKEYCANPIPETDFMVLTYALQLAVVIERILRSEKVERQEITNSKKANLVCQYIDHHYKENITIDDLSQIVFVSPSHIGRLFKKETGMTMKAYLTLRRITHAKNLIMQGCKIISLYEECGFKDYSNFYRSFVKYVGMSPLEFKETQHQIEESAIHDIGDNGID